MQHGKFNVIVDSAWGSSGKGKVASWLARTCGVTDASSCNMPNAGHTVQVDDKRTVYKALPAASHFGARSWIGPGAVLDEERLGIEVAFGKTGHVFVHERVGVLHPHHADIERNTLSKISSTMQGSGACLAEKVMRNAELWGSPIRGGFKGEVFRNLYRRAVQKGLALHEVAQGWGLSIDHGTHYPHCTSRNCGVARAMDDMSIPPRLVGDVYLVVRSYPIRVGNTADGHSGGWLPDQKELDWPSIESRTGLTGLAKNELTTVTKRVRRVATFSNQLLRDAAESNGATRMVLTFPEYIDAAAFDIRNWERLPYLVRKFIDDIEDVADTAVCAVSTGPETDAMAVAPEYLDEFGERDFIHINPNRECGAV